MTVAVISGARPTLAPFRDSDIEWEFFRCGGKGGQNVNKVSSGARGRHRPSGLVAECREERDQGKNRARCVEKLRAAYYGGADAKARATEDAARRTQVGSGMRGDKVRTYRERDDIVTDHRTENRTRLTDLQRGNWHAFKRDPVSA